MPVHESQTTGYALTKGMNRFTLTHLDKLNKGIYFIQVIGAGEVVYRWAEATLF